MAPPTEPSLFELAHVAGGISSVVGDVRDFRKLSDVVARAQPEIIFHLAAQPLVRRSYDDPLETYSTNVMGTVNLLQSARTAPDLRVIVVVTTDKCYRNDGLSRSFRESDELGGRDPYSSSKACAELVSRAFRESYFGQPADGRPGVAIATARAGNVIGGGDWATDRLIPDVIRAFSRREQVVIRNPRAVRPWQHVVEPLGGYLVLAQRLWQSPDVPDAWNFGPLAEDERPVSWVVDRMVECWGDGASWTLDDQSHPHEEQTLRLDCTMANQRLNWSPRLTLAEALRWTTDWYRTHLNGGDMRAQTLRQITLYQGGCEQPRLDLVNPLTGCTAPQA